MTYTYATQIILNNNVVAVCWYAAKTSEHDGAYLDTFVVQFQNNFYGNRRITRSVLHSRTNGDGYCVSQVAARICESLLFGPMDPFMQR